MPKTADGSNALLRDEAVSMLANLKTHFSIYLLADLSLLCESQVAATVQRLAGVGVLGALEVRHGHHLLFEEVCSLLGFRVDLQVWVWRALDADLRSIQQVLQAAEADCQLFWKAASLVFPHKVLPHVVFSRNAVFDLDASQAAEPCLEARTDQKAGCSLGLLAAFLEQQVTKEHKPLQLRGAILKLSLDLTQAVRRSLLTHRFLVWRAAKVNRTASSLFGCEPGRHDEQDLPVPEERPGPRYARLTSNPKTDFLAAVAARELPSGQLEECLAQHRRNQKLLAGKRVPWA